MKKVHEYYSTTHAPNELQGTILPYCPLPWCLALICQVHKQHSSRHRPPWNVRGGTNTCFAGSKNYQSTTTRMSQTGSSGSQTCNLLQMRRHADAYTYMCIVENSFTTREQNSNSCTSNKPPAIGCCIRAGASTTSHVKPRKQGRMSVQQSSLECSSLKPPHLQHVCKFHNTSNSTAPLNVAD